MARRDFRASRGRRARKRRLTHKREQLLDLYHKGYSVKTAAAVLGFPEKDTEELYALVAEVEKKKGEEVA